MMWDLSKIGEEQTPEDAEDGPPELLFVHGGHTARTTDISWSPQAEWHMATAAEDNILMAFCPSSNALGDGEDAEVPESELE